jgi:polyhydroxybutyrate depolymerase
MRTGAWVAFAIVAASGCLDGDERCRPGALTAGADRACAMPGWLDRGYDVHVPDGWDGTSSLPVVMLFHGGGGNRAGADRTTCPVGAVDSPACLAARATARGFVVVVPDGTGGRPLRGVRTWNAGGGQDGWDCTSGAACRSGVDDVAYVGDLLTELGAALPIDARRLYATGISNGGAISHRLACELPTPLAAIAPVAGANQFADTGGACARATPVLQIHGTEDPCWEYAGGTQACLGEGGRKTSVAATLEGWRIRNGCAPTYVDTPVPDVDTTDGVTVTHRVWDGCAAATELYRQDGAGHTWPSGWPYFGEDRIGRVGRDIGNDQLLDFFASHVAP